MFFFLFPDPNTSPDPTPPSDTGQLHPSSAFTFKSLLDNLGQSKTTCRPVTSPPSSASDDTKSSTPRTTSILPSATSSSTLQSAGYLLASQSYYGTTNGAAAPPGMYGLVPPSLLYPQLYQHPSIQLLGSDARGAYLQQMNNSKSEVVHSNNNNNAKEPCSDEPRSDGSGSNGHVVMPSARERLDALRLGALPSQQRTAQSEVATVWRPY